MRKQKTRSTFDDEGVIDQIDRLELEDPVTGEERALLSARYNAHRDGDLTAVRVMEQMLVLADKKPKSIVPNLVRVVNTITDRRTGRKLRQVRII